MHLQVDEEDVGAGVGEAAGYVEEEELQVVLVAAGEVEEECGLRRLWFLGNGEDQKQHGVGEDELQVSIVFAAAAAPDDEQPVTSGGVARWRRRHAWPDHGGGRWRRSFGG